MHANSRSLINTLGGVLFGGYASIKIINYQNSFSWNQNKIAFADAAMSEKEFVEKIKNLGDDIYISEDFVEKLKEFKKQVSKENFCFISDFDHTITTRYSEDDKLAYQCHGFMASIPRIEHIMKFHFSFKGSEMKHICANPIYWWKWFDLNLAKNNLTEQEIVKHMQEHPFRVRPGYTSVCDNLLKKNVPHLVVSAGYTNIIEHVLGKRDLMKPNMKIFGNSIIFNSDGSLTGFGPLFTSFTKHTFNNFFPTLVSDSEKRSHLIICGDGVHDTHVLKNIKYDHVLKIGFYNYMFKPGEKPHYVQQFDDFTKVFDIVIKNDGTFDCVDELIEYLLED